MFKPFGELPLQRVAIFSSEHLRSYEDVSAVRRLVEQTLDSLGLSADFIRPGDRVVLKPNWVKEHDERHPGPDQWEHVVTHPAVIEAVLRWTAAPLNGRGAMVGRCRSAFPGVDIALLDLRPEEARAIDGVVVGKTKLPGDPLGSTHV